MIRLVLQVIISQYAKADELESMRLHAVFAPIFEFRSVESKTLLEAALQLCRKTCVYNVVFLQINRECEQCTQPESVHTPAHDQTEPMTLFESSTSPRSSALTPDCELAVLPVAPQGAFDSRPRFGHRLHPAVSA